METELKKDAIYKNIKNRKLYYLCDIGLNVTDNRDHMMVSYKALYKCDYDMFFREIEEFIENFIFLGDFKNGTKEDLDLIKENSRRIDIELNEGVNKQ